MPASFSDIGAGMVCSDTHYPVTVPAHGGPAVGAAPCFAGSCQSERYIQNVARMISVSSLAGCIPLVLAGDISVACTPAALTCIHRFLGFRSPPTHGRRGCGPGGIRTHVPVQIDYWQRRTTF